MISTGRTIGLVLAIFILTSILGLLPVYSQTITEINIVINYDPVVDIGIAEYVVVFSEYIGDGGAIVDLQLIKGASVDIINVTRDDGAPLLYEYNADKGIITVYVNETSSITIYYSITGLFDEVVPYTFASIIDLTIYGVNKLSCTLVLTGTYDVSIEPSENTNVRYSDDTTIIELLAPQVYAIELYVEPTVPTTETTTTTPTETIEETTTTPVEETTTPTKTETTTPTGAPAQPGINIGLIAGIVVLLLVIGVIAYMKFLRK